MARIVTVYTAEQKPFVPVDMSLIRWLKISEALARLGHTVDIATNEPGLRARLPRTIGKRLRRVPLSRVRWHRYDVVKTLFHMGFETLEQRGGADHPFIIAKLGSVVGSEDRPGVYFYGEEREHLFEVQQRIAARARYVSILSEPSCALWRREHPEANAPLMVPGAVDAELPADGGSPYDERPSCVFAGNFYDEWYQAEVHRTLVQKINALGRHLHERGIRLHIVGHGDTERIDPSFTTCHGPVPHERAWDYMRHANVGVVFAFGSEPNENESTKLYHYLRVGLPTICEAGFPNEGILDEVGLGSVVANGDMLAMANALADAHERSWDRARAVDHVLTHHTWDARARIYEPVICSS